MSHQKKQYQCQEMPLYAADCFSLTRRRLNTLDPDDYTTFLVQAKNRVDAFNQFCNILMRTGYAEGTPDMEAAPLVDDTGDYSLEVRIGRITPPITVDEGLINAASGIIVHEIDVHDGALLVRRARPLYVDAPDTVAPAAQI